jgi:hypothetical protein
LTDDRHRTRADAPGPRVRVLSLLERAAQAASPLRSRSGPCADPWLGRAAGRQAAKIVLVSRVIPRDVSGLARSRRLRLRAYLSFS